MPSASPVFNMECPVCLEESDDTVKLACGHVFCRECNYKYAEYRKRRLMAVECPICREVVVNTETSAPVHLVLLVAAFVLFVIFMRYWAEN